MMKLQYITGMMLGFFVLAPMSFAQREASPAGTPVTVQPNPDSSSIPAVNSIKSPRDLYLDFIRPEGFSERYVEGVQRGYYNGWLPREYMSNYYGYDNPGWMNRGYYRHQPYETYTQPYAITTQPQKRVNLPTTNSPVNIMSGQPMIMPPREFVLWRDSFFLYDQYNAMYANRPEGRSNKTSVKAKPAAVNKQPEEALVQTPSALLFSQGKKALSTKKYSDALDVFSQLVKLNPENMDYQAGYGLSNLTAGNYEKAFTALSVAAKQAGEDGLDLKQFCSSANDLKVYQSRLKIYLARNTETNGKEILDLFND